MYRQIFIECENNKFKKGYICTTSDDLELTEFEKSLKIEMQIYKYHIPLLFKVSLIKKIMTEKFKIQENFLLFSKQFNIEISTNGKAIFNYFNYIKQSITTLNETSLFDELNKKNIDIKNIIFFFVKKSELSVDIHDYICPNQSHVNSMDYEYLIDCFINNTEFDYHIENEQTFRIYDFFDIKKSISLNFLLHNLNWTSKGYIKYKDSMLFLENISTNDKNIYYINNDEYIEIKKKYAIFNKIKTISFIRQLCNFFDKKEIIKKKTKIYINNFFLNKINPLIDVFLENDILINNIKKTFDKKLKIIFNKHNFIFISDGYSDVNLVYFAHFLYSFNINNYTKKRNDKIDGFFISRTCQNLNTKKRIPIIINELDNIINEKDRLYIDKTDNKEVYFDDTFYYKCVDEKHQYLGFLSKFDSKCIPCCYIKLQKKRSLFNKCILSNIENTPVQNELFNLMILNSNRILSNTKQLKFIPSYINDIINKNNTISITKTNRLIKTDKYIMLKYSNLNDFDKYSDDYILNNYIIMSEFNFSLNLYNLDFKKIIYTQSDNYEDFVLVKKKKENDDKIEIIENTSDELKSFILSKINNEILIEEDNIKITNIGIYYKDKLIEPKTKFISIINSHTIDFMYESHKQEIVDLFNNIECENISQWLKIKYINMLNINKIKKTPFNKFKYFI